MSENNSGHLEFYITPNPPLLPKGVEQVFEFIRDNLANDVIEVLYEPDVPWFKCIGEASARQQATAAIQDFILRIAEDETQVANTNIAYVVKRTATGRPHDIGIKVDDPRVVPWVEYLDSEIFATTAYDAFQYPQQMQPLPYKTIWRGLEEHPELDLSYMFEVAPRFWDTSNAPTKPENFGDFIGCQALFNLQENIMYIGGEDRGQVQKGALMLDNMLAALENRTDRDIMHLVAEGEAEVCYKWTTHTGLNRKTHLGFTATENDYSDLQGSVMVRLADDSRGKPPETSRRTKCLDLEGSASIFDGFSYSQKKPGLVRPPSAPSAIANDRSRSGASSTTGAIQRAAFAAHTALDKRSPSPNPRRILPSTIHTGQANKDETHSQPLTPLDTLVAAHNKIASWMQGVRGESSAAQSSSGHRSEEQRSEPIPEEQRSVPAPEEQRSEPDPENGDLLTFAPSPVDSPGVEPLQTRPHQVGVEHPIFSETVDNHRVPDLLDLGEASESVPFNRPRTPSPNDGSGVRDFLGEISPSKNIFGSVLPLTSHSVMDGNTEDDTEDLLIFGLAEEKPKSFHRTMNQQSARGQQTLPTRPMPDVPSPQARPLSTSGSVASAPLTPSRHQRPASQQQTASIPDKQPSGGQVVKGIGAQMEEEVGKMAKIMETMSGTLQLSVQFGRVYLLGLGNADVQSEQGGPTWEPDVLLDHLNKLKARVKVGFSPFLSSSRLDGDRIALISAVAEPSWVFSEGDAIYQFDCVSRSDPELRFQLNINANSFAVSINRPEEEKDALFVHCPSSSWGLKASIKRTISNDLPKECTAFAEAFVQTLSVSDKSTSHEICLKFQLQLNSDIEIQSVVVKNKARYKSKAANSSILDIILTQRLEKSFLNRFKSSVTFQASGDFKTRPHSAPAGSQEWIEASISSARANDVFTQNRSLQFAERVNWSSEKLAEEGVFRDICRPAIGMVRFMDRIGAENDNGQGPGARTSMGTKSVARQAIKGHGFW